LAIASICSADSVSPFIQPPLNSSRPLARLKSASALAAEAASPCTNTSAVGPSRKGFSASAPALSAARSVSVFLTMRKRVSLSRRRVRSSAAWVTDVPR
jgi:hypothetical protein